MKNDGRMASARKGLKRIVRSCLPALDYGYLPFAAAAGLILKLGRLVGFQRLRQSRETLKKIGVFPIIRHYFEPAFHPADLPVRLDAARDLPGLNLNIAAQVDLLERLATKTPPTPFGDTPTGELEFYYGNNAFESGDACAWWAMIMYHRPRRIVEIGSGYSTLIARAAIDRLDHRCEHICFEPYEEPWLERTGATIIREPVETADTGLFESLAEGDILFIDSSHVIRPGGDVLFEYLELLPRLRPGVLVHIHDIFTPRHYLSEWVHDEVRLWNEQYLLEAFLSMNDGYEIVLALNYLKHAHYDRMKAAFPRLTEAREPGSFYIRRVVPSPNAKAVS